MKPHPPIPAVVFRYLCLLTALANIIGSIGLVLFFVPLFKWLGVPLPTDLHAFTVELVLSFSMGVLALLLFISHTDRARSIALLKIGILGKGAYSLVTYYFYAVHDLHWFYLVFAAWDAAYVVIFFLYWIQLESWDLLQLQQGVFNGVERKRTGKALLVGFSLTGNGRKALERLKKGLEAGGYHEVVIEFVQAHDPVYQSPISFLSFWRIIVRAWLRRPTRVARLDVPEDHDYDLIVVESQTWLLGMSAPVEAMLRDERNAKIFRGRDAVSLVVCRGAFRRTMAMAVRWLQHRGANVIAARGYTHAGREPRRLLSLWLYLIFRRAGTPKYIAEPEYGLPESALVDIERLGDELARRARTRPHWALLLESEALDG